MEFSWRPKVLVIDNNLPNLSYICEALKQDCELYCATHGLAGIEAAKESLPDFILLDANMTDQSGLSLSESLKRDPLTKNIRVIFISTFYGAKKLTNGYHNSDTASEVVNRPPSENSLIERLCGLHECAA